VSFKIVPAVKKLIEDKYHIKFIRKCISKYNCDEDRTFKIPTFSDKFRVELEYGFNYNGKRMADVALLKGDKIICIFEICNTHKTAEENRPEPWFEIDANKLIKDYNDNKKEEIMMIECIRDYCCVECKEMEYKKMIDVFCANIDLNYIKDKLLCIKCHQKCTLNHHRYFTLQCCNEKLEEKNPDYIDYFHICYKCLPINKYKNFDDVYKYIYFTPLKI
jgi:hypothetical protein